MKKSILFLHFMFIFTVFSLTRVGEANSQVGQLWETIVGNPEATQNEPPLDSGGDDVDFGNVPGCGEIEQRLKDDFGVTVKSGGDRSWCSSYISSTPQSVDCETRQGIWKALANPAKSAGYRQKLKKSNAWTVQCFVHPSGSAYASGCVSSGTVMNINNCAFVKSYPSNFNFFFLHESGHLIGARNSRLYQSFPVSSLASSDNQCYDGLFIKTYSLRTTTARNESFAEAMALYVYNSKVGTLGSISNFRGQCDNTYKWMRSNVYNDYEF